MDGILCKLKFWTFKLVTPSRFFGTKIIDNNVKSYSFGYNEHLRTIFLFAASGTQCIYLTLVTYIGKLFSGEVYALFTDFTLT